MNFVFHRENSCRRFCVLMMTTLLLLCLNNQSAAQLNRIKKETAIGTAGEEVGPHSVTSTSNGEIVTVTQSREDSTSGVPFTGAILVTKLTANQQIIWQKSYNDPNAWRTADGIIETADKGYLVLGSVVTINPGGFIKINLLKLNVNGEIEWEKRFGAPAAAEGAVIPEDLEETDNGDFIILADIGDPAPGNNPNPGMQMWMAKISPTGTMISEKVLTSTHRHQSFDLAKSNDGNFIAAGVVYDDVEVAPGRSTSDAVLIKFDEAGTVLWQKYLGGNSEDELNQVEVDAQGNVFAAGITYSNTGDFQSNHGNCDGWIVKLSPTGNLLWNKLIGGSDVDAFDAISISKEGHIYAGGGTFSNDGDLASNYYLHTIWLTKFNESNNEVEHGFFGHKQEIDIHINDIVILETGRVYFVAESHGGNIFMSNPKGGIDSWLVEPGVSNTLKGYAFIDANGNGQKDPGEKNYTGGKMTVRNETTNEVETKIANSGRFLAYLDTGKYEVSYIPGEPYYTVVPATKRLSYTAFDISDSIAFALVPIPGKNDLSVTIFPIDLVRPGFNATYQIRYANRGSSEITNATLSYVKNPHFTVTSATPAGYTLKGDTLSWTLPTLRQLDEGVIILNGKFDPPPQLNLGDTLISTALIYPVTGDQQPDDNTSSLREITRGSYDPNDKTELHGGTFPSALIGTGNLTYLVRFQNTGTDTAFRIFIRDTLDARVDPLSLKIIAASHIYSLSIKNGSQLQWDFDNIRLPDSNVNEKASHGYILYSVKPGTTLVAGDVITNRASIYFDYNLPVVTNKTSTQIVEAAAIAIPKPVITGLKTTYCGNEQVQTIRISNLAAAPQATATVKLNGNVLGVDNNGNFLLDPTKMLSGNHNIEITFSKGGIISMLNAGFAITAPIKPIVKLTSNVTVVSNTSTPVLLTAIAMAGSGISPQFTFSTDRGISDILRVESVSNVVLITSQFLRAGDNWIYVRMRSGEQCLTSATVLDSIKIVRVAVTDIVDVDFPTTIISAYPNPFRSDITIKGLQASGSYTIQLLTASGKLIRTQEVERRTSATLYNLDVNKGIYFIRLYDKKKMRWIGSMPVIGM